MSAPAATIVITTKDRKEDLREALCTALAQTADVEVLVIDDGSGDGTADMVRTEFPQVRLERSEQSLGLVEQRNRAARLASAPILVSIDDDARLISPETVAQTLRDFDDPRIGAVAIPFLDVRQTTVARQIAPDAERTWVTNVYVGTAHALRRDVFLALGGYRGEFRHMAEEYDLCLRLYGAGYVVRIGRADLLHHLESPRRDTARNIVLGRRNELLNAWHNVPMPHLVGRVAQILAGSVALAAQWRAPREVARGLWAGARAVAAARKAGRTPVPAAAYRVDRRLRREGPLPLEDIAAQLPSRAA
jgi:glycosyltransferase involved in cell wall biosynthesis